MRDTWRLGLGAIIHLEICVLCISAFQKTTAAKTSGSIAADCCPHCGMRTAKTQHTHEAPRVQPMKDPTAKFTSPIVLITVVGAAVLTLMLALYAMPQPGQ